MSKEIGSDSRGGVGKQPVVGMRERKSGRIKARPIDGTDAAHLKSAVRSEVKPGSTIYTDGHKAYKGMGEYKGTSKNW